MATDDTDVRAELHRLAKENRRLWDSHDELMRDQTTAEKLIEKMEKLIEKMEKRLKVVEAWLAAEDDRLKPAAKDSTADGH